MSSSKLLMEEDKRIHYSNDLNFRIVKCKGKDFRDISQFQCFPFRWTIDLKSAAKWKSKRWRAWCDLWRSVQSIFVLYDRTNSGVDFNERKQLRTSSKPSNNRAHIKYHKNKDINDSCLCKRKSVFNVHLAVIKKG